MSAKSLYRINKNIKPDGIDPSGVKVTAAGRFSRFTVRRCYQCIHGYKGYRILDRQGYEVPGAFPKTIAECAARLIELTANGM